MSAVTAPSASCQFASPVVVHAARLVPSNNVVQGASGAAALPASAGPWPGVHAADTPIVAAATTPRSMSSPTDSLADDSAAIFAHEDLGDQPRFGGSLAARPNEHYRACRCIPWRTALRRRSNPYNPRPERDADRRLGDLALTPQTSMCIIELMHLGRSPCSY